MTEVSESITIDVPRQQVWEFITEPSNNLVVSSNLESFEQVGDGPIAVGTRFRGVVKIAGRKLEWSNEVTRFDAAKAFHSRSLESPIEFTYDTDLEDDGDGTKVTVSQQIGSFGGFFGKLADPLVVRMYKKDVRANLEKMKEILEAGES